MSDTIDLTKVHEILQARNGGRNGLVSLLGDIQAEFGYLPEAALRAVATLTNRNIVDLYGVATFYRSFSLTPRGKHVISVCLGTACHVRSAPVVIQEFERQLGIRAGETTPDGEFTLEQVNCLGACALGPVVAVDGDYFAHVNCAKVKSIIAGTRAGPERKITPEMSTVGG